MSLYQLFKLNIYIDIYIYIYIYLDFKHSRIRRMVNIYPEVDLYERETC